MAFFDEAQSIAEKYGFYDKWAVTMYLQEQGGEYDYSKKDGRKY